MTDLIVVTGGAHAGKTTIVQALAARGHAVLPEAALEIITELNDEIGLEAQQALRRGQPAEFQRRITTRQHERERVVRTSGAPRVFCDRGALDGRAYCLAVGTGWPDDLGSLTASSRYAHVFVLETLRDFDPRHGTGRLDTYEESVRIGEILHDVYAPHAALMTRIPEAPLEERISLILDVVDTTEGS